MAGKAKKFNIKPKSIMEVIKNTSIMLFYLNYGNLRN
ncbi:hypothetical protein Q428_02530 [Fervidicella metallireducens AeB]|uniref:Uncharacterized protein n=1 Tax=Fervidicella metallireducens AeB TaxID=1403537 RepID=A0A017RXL5_9CLOT|nr:hypothetical protein Q428_02530 [Fervidicella metallireducens AeB]